MSAYAAQEVTCEVSGPDAGTFWIASFTSSGHETSFLYTVKKPSTMTCIGGTDWAVVISWKRTPPTFNQVGLMATKMGGTLTGCL
jgi:hypothetical protein